MSRATFYLIKEDANENLVLDRDINVSNLTATKNGLSFGTTFYNNGDGTYYFEPSGSGTYSVFLNGLVQDEFRNIYIADDDTLLQGMVDNETIQFNAGTLQVINGAILLRQSDVKNNFKATASNYPASANLAYQLSQSIATKEPADSTIIKEEDINNDLTTGGATKVVSAQALRIDLDGSTYLSGYNSYNSALLKLDSLINTVKVGGGYSSFLPYGYDDLMSQSGSASWVKTVDGVATSTGYPIPIDGAIKGISGRVEVSNYSGSATTANSLRVDLYLNGNKVHYSKYDYALQIDFTADGSKKNFNRNLNTPFSIGDTITLKIFPNRNAADVFDMQDISLLIEIEK